MTDMDKLTETLARAIRNASTQRETYPFKVFDPNECEANIIEWCRWAARDALSSLTSSGLAIVPVEATEWQPAETAPRDGSKFDAWCRMPNGSGLGSCRFTDVEMRGDGTGFGYVYHTETGAKWVYLDKGDDIYPPWRMTHWRKPPASPLRTTEASR